MAGQIRRTFGSLARAFTAFALAPLADEALHGLIRGCPFPDRCFTNFPCSSASAATFNRTLWHMTGSAQIDEVRAMYNTQHTDPSGQIAGMHVRGPQLNPQRDPRWGRNDNSPGEDAYLEGQYGAWMVLGGQGADADGTYGLGERRKAICEMKHFDAYSVEAGRDTATDTFDISLRDLVEYYFVPLQACIDLADVGAFMCSYNAINGTATCGDQWLNVDVVRNTWNFSGVIESDCGAISGIVAHGNAKNGPAAAIAAVKATVDVECDSVYNTLPNSTAAGKISRGHLEAAASRVLKGRFQIGQFDPAGPKAPWDALTIDAIYSAKNQQLSLEGAQQAAVLLRNPGSLLPLRRGTSIAVIGPNGNVADVFQGQYHGGSCPTDSGTAEPGFSQTYFYDCLPTAYTELRQQNTGGTTTFVNGCALTPSASDGSGHPEGQPCAALDNMTGVMAAVNEADVVLLFLGLDIKMTNKEGQDRDHGWTGYALPGMQQELARQVAAAGKPVVVVELSGMATGMDFIAAQAGWPVLVGGYGGRFGPVALAQIMFGEISPTGKLPYTVYPEAWANSTAMTDMALTAGDGRTYKWYKGEAPAPFLFGEGLTYTTFKVAAAVVRGGCPSAALTCLVVDVANVGATPAAEVVMLFSRAVSLGSDAPTPLPNRQLFDFARTPTLAPGATHRLLFAVTADGIALGGWDGSRKAYKGVYSIGVYSGGRTAAAVVPLEVSETVTLSTLPPPRPN